MNDILKLEMLMIEVTTLKCKMKYFNILCTCGGMKEIYFLDILLNSKWNYSSCYDFAFIFGT